MGPKFARWFVFGVLIALLPILVDFIVKRSEWSQPSLNDLLGRGELLLISAGLCSAAIGELLGTGSKFATLKIISGGGCLLVLASASLSYANLAGKMSKNIIFSADVVSHDSLIIYLVGVVASASCVILAELAPQ